jgi:hypothetical protein
MIEVLQEIEKDWYLIHLKDTRHYQIWNKWDLYEVLLNATNYSANNRKPYLDIYDDDLPVTESTLNIMVAELKRVKEENNKKNNN